MTTLRDKQRYKRRVSVRFWHADRPEPHEGFTINVSLGGMFIATRAVAPPRSRLRIEVLDAKHNFVFHGEVMHAIKVPPGFQRVRDSGMGVRLCQIHELTSALIEERPSQPGTSPGPRGSAPLAASPPQRAAPSTDQPRGAAGAGAASPGPAATLVRPSPGASPGRYRSSPAGGTTEPLEAPAAGASAPVYVVRFSSPEVFLDVFRRHHEEGGFFVPTRDPSRIGEEITVTLELLQSGVEPLPLKATVAHKVTAELGQAAGMRVTFAEPEAALDALRRVIQSLRRGRQGSPDPT